VFSDKIDDLFFSQLRDWELAKINYSQLERVRTKKISFGSFEVFVQFNPERIRSSSAKVDEKSINSRPCFLCEKNRPQEQRGVFFEKKFTVLVNPFPIFNRHLTIASEQHTDQRISSNFSTLLSLAEALPSYIIFYNGPECGASAPDHLHFQAGNHGFVPIEKDFRNKRHAVPLMVDNGIEIWQWTGYLRGIVTLKSNNREKLVQTFDRFFNSFLKVQSDRPEPMLNILTDFTFKEWIIHIIPRKQHRPSYFFNEDDNKILVSPAAVDLGGVIITPREEDFKKITKDIIAEIFSQVCFNENEISGLLNGLL
jgi:ATP adenylyltransferase/5',5'''-P-1,P-4-tetraphosphate phosphorylase II